MLNNKARKNKHESRLKQTQYANIPVVQLTGRDTPKRFFCASAESEASAFRKLPNQKLRQKLRFLPKLLYLTAASAIFTKSAIRKIVELHWSTSERLLNIGFLKKFVKIYASASASPSLKLLLPKLRPNSSAEAHAESRFGVSL